MNEEGVDKITIESNVVNHGLFNLHQTSTYDTNQLLRYLLRDRVDINEFRFLIDRYNRNEIINICVPRTRIERNTELLIIADRKYFPELKGIDDQLLLNACGVIYRSHVALGLGLTNDTTKESTKFSFYICPFDVLYNDFIRSFFLSLAAQAFAKFRYGVTEYDKTKLLTAIYEKETLHDLEKMNLNDLEESVHNGKKIYAAFNDSIMTLPFMNQYDLIRNAILAQPPSRFENENPSLTKDQIYNLRIKELTEHKYFSPIVYRDSIVMDLDYCPTCLKLSDQE